MTTAIFEPGSIWDAVMIMCRDAIQHVRSIKSSAQRKFPAGGADAKNRVPTGGYNSSFGQVEGDIPVSFETVMGEYGGMVSRLAYSYAETGDEYEDLRQDILINIWRGLEKFRGDCQLSTWVYRVALNTCVSNIRSRKRRGERLGLDEVLPSILKYSDSVEERELIEQLHDGISSLGMDDRAIINLWLDEKSYDEIAEIMGMKRNTVATRLRRIREKLSKYFDK